MSSSVSSILKPIRLASRDSKARIEHVRDAFGGLQIEPHADDDFYLDAMVCSFQGLGLMVGDISGLTLRRTHAGMKEGDGFTMWVVRDGAAFGESRQKGVAIRAGEAVLARQDEAGYCAPTEAMRGMSLRLSNELLVPLLRDVDAAVLRPVPAGNEALRQLSLYADFVMENMPSSGELQRLAASHIYDLAALALGATRDAGEMARQGGLRAARLEAIRRDILANLADGDLSLGAIAARHGISPVYVRKLFEGEQTSFTAFVLEQRLQRAFDTLVDPSRKQLPIGTIAYDVGFGDLSYFNRAFRRRFGATPSDIRQLGHINRQSEK